MAALTTRNAEILRAIHELGDGTPQTSRISEAVGLTEQAVGYQISRLSYLGLVRVVLTDEGERALSESGKRSPQARPVLRIDLETGERVRFESVADAARESYCSRFSVTAHANGVFKSDFCDRWRFNWITEE